MSMHLKHQIKTIAQYLKNEFPNEITTGEDTHETVLRLLGLLKDMKLAKKTPKRSQRQK